MNRSFCVLLLTAGSALVATAADAEADADQRATDNPAVGISPMPLSATEFEDVVRPTLLKFCVDCHHPDDPEDAVGFLKDLTSDEVAQRRGLWANVAEQLNNRTMPPATAMQPGEDVRLHAAQWIESHLQATACGRGSFAGRPVPRRLNRDQYTNAIEDLTGRRFDFIEQIPADGSGGEGFDNNGEVLFLPPMLMERYLELADHVLDRIIDLPPINNTYRIVQSDDRYSLDQTGNKSIPLPGGREASFIIRVDVESEFDCSIEAKFDAPQRADQPTEQPDQATETETRKPTTYQLTVHVDDLPVMTAEYTGDGGVDGKNAPWTTLNLGVGLHRITLSSAADQPPARIDWVHLKSEGPDGSDAEQRKRLTTHLFRAGKKWLGNDDARAAREILSSFARLAFRRPVVEPEIDALMRLYERSTERGEPFAQAIKLPLKAILVSPKFLFVSESDPIADSKSTNREYPDLVTQFAANKNTFTAVSDLQLASRLAMFLWHSIPDDELLIVAEQGRLHQDDELRRQTERMLGDDRVRRTVSAFANQWLGTNAVGITKIPDTNFYRPTYNSELVNALRDQVTETMMYHLRNDRPITDWLDAEYVIVNERLAKHYGIVPVPKEQEGYVKILMPDDPRTGVLGLGAVHLLTSYSRRTSPVLRGGWVLETLFGTRLPAPPPDAGQLTGGEKENEKKTVRERLTAHRDDPTCAACHSIMDPIGFALENFDVLGRWRDKEGKHWIDAVGELPDGTTFDGPVELRAALLMRTDAFVHQFCRRMLGFALGRSLEDADGCSVEMIAEQVHKSNFRIRSLINGVIHSVPFKNRQYADHTADTADLISD